MKRSEALKLIEETYARMILIFGYDTVSPRDVAHTLLNLMEDNGMQPPGYEGRIANGKKYKPEMGPVDVVWFKGWEPEDEESV